MFVSILIIPHQLAAPIEFYDLKTSHIYTVDDEGDGDFTTIMSALHQAEPGDTIQVYSGTYEENLIIEQPQLTIEGIPYELGSGADEDHPIVFGDSTDDVIRIETREIYLSGFIIQNSGSDYFDAGIGIYQDHNIIEANGITGNFYGIVLNNCTENIITENYILANTMDGIYLASTNQNIITKNTINENGFQGMFLFEANQNNIKENTITLNGKDGIQLRDRCINNIIEENIIHSNNIDGIKCWMDENTNNIIRKNTIYSNGWNGIHIMNAENNHISENEIKLNLFNGIHIGECNNNIITKNTIKENQEEGIMVLFDKSYNNKFYHNNIINDNAYDNGNNKWDNGEESGGNYWSYYTGSDENNDGIGDTAYIIPGNNNQDNYPFINKLIPPNTPSKPRGPTLGTVGQTYRFTTSATATDQVQFGWDWNGDNIVDEWTRFYDSGQQCETMHQWENNGTYHIKVKAMDNYGFQSNWSNPLSVTMPKQTKMKFQFFELINTLFESIFHMNYFSLKDLLIPNK